MLVARVELWPGGDETKVEHLGVVAIVNRGETGEVGKWRYDAQLTLPRQTRPRIATGIHHYRKRGWEILLAHALEVLGE